MTRSYSSFLFWLGLTIAASLVLYHTSDRVTALDRQLHSLNAQIDQEQQSIHVLNAEWVYLANPARIEAEAQRHLALQPTAPRRVVTLNNIASLLPVQNGAEPQIATAQAAPAAPVAAPVRTADNAVTHTTRDRVVAALNAPLSTARHINERMIMQHTPTVPSPDRIGAMIGTLGLHP